VRIAFHTECGYIHTAVLIHSLCNAIQRACDPKDTTTMVL
jgi:hypothetical protein